MNDKGKILLVVFIVLAIKIFAQNDSLSYFPSENHPSSYLELGITSGMPTFINATVGYCFHSMNLRLSGGYWGNKLNGAQATFAYVIKDTYRIRHNIGVAVGRSQDMGTDYCYVGPVYDYNYKHFFIEAGFCRVFSVKRGEFDFPYWIIIQVGYVHRF